MKCGDCGQLIPPKRGFCVNPICHNKMIGGDRPEKVKPSKLWQNGDKKRCPFCSGAENGKEPCFLSACDRGPKGRSCGCHFMLSGMGTPGHEARILQEEVEARRLKAHREEKARAYKYARFVA